MINLYDEEAKRKNLVVLLHIGFTALPTDLLCYCAVKFLRDKHQTECKRASMYTWANGGGMSGTTWEAAMEIDRNDQKGADDPFALGGLRKGEVRDEDKDVKKG
jgi:short subunit dehydrogenase-like uncharacterized protein